MIDGSLALDDRSQLPPVVPLPSGEAARPPDSPPSEAAGGAPLFKFADGLLGFPELRRFTVEATEVEGVYWMQSTECDMLAFVLADPFVVVPGYSVELGRGELGAFRDVDPACLGLLAIVTIRDGESATANLQGPLLLDFDRRLGRQIVLRESAWGVVCPVELGGL